MNHFCLFNRLRKGLQVFLACLLVLVREQCWTTESSDRLLGCPGCEFNRQVVYGSRDVKSILQHISTQAQFGVGPKADSFAHKV